MKKYFLFFSIFTIVSPALATDPTVYDTSVATAGYVKGAIDAVTSEYNESTNPKGRIVINGSGANVSDVSVSQSGQIVYTKTNQVTAPVGSADSSSRANIWIQ